MVAGTELAVATVEDVVIFKLEWARQAESARQVEDVAALLRACPSNLDLEYVARWVEALDLGDQWAAARRLANG